VFPNRWFATHFQITNTYFSYELSRQMGRQQSQVENHCSKRDKNSFFIGSELKSKYKISTTINQHIRQSQNRNTVKTQRPERKNKTTTTSDRQDTSAKIGKKKLKFQNQKTEQLLMLDDSEFGLPNATGHSDSQNLSKPYQQQQQQDHHQQQQLSEIGFKTTTATVTESVFLVFPLGSENINYQQENLSKLEEPAGHVDQLTLLVYPQDIGDENYVRQDFEEDNFVRQTRQLNKTTTITDDDDSSCYVQTCDQTISGRQLSYSRFGLLN
jgi:hypothetical protein